MSYSIQLPSSTTEINYDFSKSLAFQNLSFIPSEEKQNSLIKQELQFLYGTHYYAEVNGEVALEHIRQYTYRPTIQNKILDMQMKDEARHAHLLNGVVSSIGLDEASTDFAQGYKNILFNANTLAEKVFIFQIMTEAVSAAYLQWRLQKVKSSSLNQIDQEIFEDEMRHLKMGKGLLEMCDPEDVALSLTADKKKTLIRKMSQMCAHHFSKGIQRILVENNIVDHYRPNPSDLDMMVARSILVESKAVPHKNNQMISLKGDAT